MKKWSEETISMILGLLMVGLVSFVVIRVVDHNKGKIDIPGVSIENSQVVIKNQDKPTLVQLGAANKGKTDSNKQVYEVKSGDNLWKIATSQLNNGYRWQEIAKLNQLKNPGLIWVGMKLKMPQQEKTAVIEEEKKLPVMGKDYVIGRGDNLWKISLWAYGDGYQWVKIWQANKPRINQPGLLEIGMKLAIPNIEDEGDGKGVIK